MTFFLSQQLRWKRGSPTLRNENKNPLYSYLPLSERETLENKEQIFIQRYQLKTLLNQSTQLDYQDNLYLLDVLEQLDLDLSDASRLQILDIGCKNWNYVFALERFFSYWHCAHKRQVTLRGIEVDAYGLYRNLYSRFDYAQAYMKQTGNPDIDYRVEDVVHTPLSNFHIITLFYPFVTHFTLLHWGLPLKFYRPQSLFHKAIEMLQPNGLLIIFNQTQAEYTLTMQLLTSEKVTIEKTQPIVSRFVRYYQQTMDRWAIVARKRL